VIIRECHVRCHVVVDEAYDLSHEGRRRPGINMGGGMWEARGARGSEEYS